jgi:hypothetical protein
VEVDRAAEVSVASVISIHTDRYANATMGECHGVAQSGDCAGR